MPKHGRKIIGRKQSPNSGETFPSLATKDPFKEDVLDKVQPSGGLFWDDDNRLLASMVFNGTDESILRLNVSPDLLHTMIDLGIVLGVEHNGVPTFGIAIQEVLAFGLS